MKANANPSIMSLQLCSVVSQWALWNQHNMKAWYNKQLFTDWTWLIDLLKHDAKCLLGWASFAMLYTLILHPHTVNYLSTVPFLIFLKINIFLYRVERFNFQKSLFSGNGRIQTGAKVAEIVVYRDKSKWTDIWVRHPTVFSGWFLPAQA